MATLVHPQREGQPETEMGLPDRPPLLHRRDRRRRPPLGRLPHPAADTHAGHRLGNFMFTRFTQ